MAIKTKANPSASQNPLVMRLHRVMDAFAKSDDERDYYLDRHEGFLFFVDLDKSEEELEALEKELLSDPSRYCLIPKLTFYEVKKLMEGFVNEKVYDIDTKEKLLDIITSKEARENFLEFIFDHHSELERWQSYYQERFRIRIIEWLRQNKFDFVFEEDLEMTKSMVDKLKLNTFEPRVGKDLMASRKVLQAKAKTYYSSEALNPRPKRGRPPKQIAKVETEPQFSNDIFVTVPKPIKPFLFLPEYQAGISAFTISSKYTSEADMISHRRRDFVAAPVNDLNDVQRQLAALKSLTTKFGHEPVEAPAVNGAPVLASKAKSAPRIVDDFEPKVKRDRRDMKAEKALEASFFESRKNKASGMEEKVVAKKAAVKAPQKQAAPAPKARLRSITKPAKVAPVKAKAKAPAPKAAAKPLRHLRRAKKK